jgi:DNA-binding response OmpR family regulator
MSNLFYDLAETLVYDPVSANRTATRSALYSIGFRKIETVATIETFAEAIRRRPPDLALCEAQGVDNELCGLIQSMRQGAPGFNPFVIIIVTAWDKNAALVQRVVNSGADDLLLRPFSTTLLAQRIEAHAAKRKSFVITSDYVGPDRRKDNTRVSNVELFMPPNSLKMKAIERLSAEETASRLEIEMKAARDVLNSEKLKRDAFQVCVLWRLIQDQSPDAPKYEAELTKAGVLAKAIGRRCRETEFEIALEWCDGIVNAVEGLEVGVDRAASMHLLGNCSMNLIQLLNPEMSAEQHMAEVDKIVAMIRARNAAPAPKNGNPAAKPATATANVTAPAPAAAPAPQAPAASSVSAAPAPAQPAPAAATAAS